jgi:hypothetical protein
VQLPPAEQIRAQRLLVLAAEHKQAGELVQPLLVEQWILPLLQHPQPPLQDQPIPGHNANSHPSLDRANLHGIHANMLRHQSWQLMLSTQLDLIRHKKIFSYDVLDSFI